MPYVFGKVRVGVTFISEPWAIRSTEVRTDMGKKDEVTGDNYWCSFAAALCLGPIDAMHEIRMDDTVVWTGPVTRASDDYLDITIEDFEATGFVSLTDQAIWWDRTEGIKFKTPSARIEVVSTCPSVTSQARLALRTCRKAGW